MDGAIARRAAAAGVTIIVDSDCHRSEFLRRQMRFGVGTARRGWIEPKHVLNTRSVDEVLQFVSRKRARG
jgi:DNA polymerase (family 10)